MVDNKEIQRQRMMAYFIDAAKEIIKEEGVKSLTARKVGERAGYSYATIYNYFSDLNTLMVYCVFDFLEDCYEYLLGFKDDTMDCGEQVVAYTLAYFDYFTKNPDIFQIIFIQELGNLPDEIAEKDTRPSVSLLMVETIARCAREGYIEKNDVELISELISSSIHGKLLFLINRSDAVEKDHIVGSIKNEIRFLIGKERRK